MFFVIKNVLIRNSESSQTQFFSSSSSSAENVFGDFVNLWHCASFLWYIMFICISKRETILLEDFSDGLRSCFSDPPILKAASAILACCAISTRLFLNAQHFLVRNKFKKLKICFPSVWCGLNFIEFCGWKSSKPKASGRKRQKVTPSIDGVTVDEMRNYWRDIRAKRKGE